jgi:hypothetical protein
LFLLFFCSFFCLELEPYQAQIIGHGTEEDGVRKLNKKTGKTIAEELKQLTSTIHDTQAQLTKTLLLSCDGFL